VVHVNSSRREEAEGSTRVWTLRRGGERGVEASITVVRAERAVENHLWSGVGDGVIVGG